MRHTLGAVLMLIALTQIIGCRDPNPLKVPDDPSPVVVSPPSGSTPAESTPTTSSSSIELLYGLRNTEETIPITNNTRRADPTTFLGQIRYLYARNGDCSDTKPGNLIRDKRAEQLVDIDLTSNQSAQIWDSVIVDQSTSLKVGYLKALQLDFGNSYKYSMTRMSTAAHVITPNVKWNAAVAKYKTERQSELWDDNHYCAVWYVIGVTVEQAVVKRIVSVDAGGKGSYMVNVAGKAHYGTEQNSVKEVYLLDIAPAKLPMDVKKPGDRESRGKQSLEKYMQSVYKAPTTGE